MLRAERGEQERWSAQLWPLATGKMMLGSPKGGGRGMERAEDPGMMRPAHAPERLTRWVPSEKQNREASCIVHWLLSMSVTGHQCTSRRPS